MEKIITTGRLGKEFCAAIKKSHHNFDIRYADELNQEDIEWADCLAAFTVPPEKVISKMKWIHSFGAGVDGFIKANKIHPATILTRTVGRLGFKMGEFCLAHILNFYQDTFSVYENQKEKKWEATNPVTIEGKTVLILGTGEMAKGIVSVLNPIRIKTIGVNTSGIKPSNDYFKCVRFDDIPAVAGDVSCIINTLPLTTNTRGLLNENIFKEFHNALFINVGRGESLVTDDLISSIENSSISFAVLDVFKEEPLPEDSILWNHPKIFISPHQSAVTDIDDIIESFNEAYRCIIAKEKNHLFIDVNREY